MTKWRIHPNGGGKVAITATVDDAAYIGRDARVYCTGDYWMISGLSHRITWTRSDNSLAIGCCHRTVAEWLANPVGDDGETDDVIRDLVFKIFGNGTTACTKGRGATDLPAVDMAAENEANARLISIAPELAECLRQLHDIQNGPPLVRREAKWREIMMRAETLLGIIGDEA